MKNNLITRIKTAYGIIVKGNTIPDREKALIVTTPEFPINAARVMGPAFQSQAIVYSDRQKMYLREGYLSNDIIYSIINLILNKVKISGWGWYKVVNEKSYGEYTLLQKRMSTTDYALEYKDDAVKMLRKDYQKMMMLRKESIQPVTPDNRLADLIKYPNPDQSWQDMIEEGCGFKLISGNKFRSAIISRVPVSSSKGLPLEINNLPTQHMVILPTKGQFPVRAASYQYEEAYIAPFTKEEMLHEKYWNPDWNAGCTQLMGMSPIQAAWQRLKLSNSSIQSGLNYTMNGGAESLLTPDIQDWDALANTKQEQLDNVKDTVEYAVNGGPMHRNTVAVLNAPWKLTRLRMSAEDIQLIGTELWNLRMLCNVWGVPSQLMNDPENKIQANSSSGEKALVLRCAMPLLIAERDSMNRKFQTDWGLKGKNIILDFDPAAFPELEENKKEQADYLATSWWVTPNQKLQEQGLPISNDPNMDKVWMPANLIPMDDVNAQPLEDENDSIS